MRICRRVLAVLSLSFLLAPAPTVAKDGPLIELITTQGVSGFERDVRDRIASMLPSWAKPKVDEAGNLVVTIGQGQPHLLVVTSVDEDGYLVSGITDDGFLRLTRVSTGAASRLFDQFVYGQPVVIRTAGVGGARRSARPRRVRHDVEPPAARPRRVDRHQGPRRRLRRRGRGDEGRRRRARHPPARHGRPPRTRPDPGRRADGGRGGAGSGERAGARQAPGGNGAGAAAGRRARSRSRGPRRASSATEGWRGWRSRSSPTACCCSRAARYARAGRAGSRRPPRRRSRHPRGRRGACGRGQAVGRGRSRRSPRFAAPRRSAGADDRAAGAVLLTPVETVQDSDIDALSRCSARSPGCAGRWLEA